MRQPNVLFVFADQLRAQATGFGGDPNARTPTLDALAAGSVGHERLSEAIVVVTPAVDPSTG